MLKAGDKLWNGAIVSKEFAETYNRASETIDAFKAKGWTVPEQLLNGRHNLIANYPK